MEARQQQTVQTLLEALPYIRRFSGCTMVVEIAGATLWSPGLKASFAGDVALLQLVGMKPIVVHPATDVPTHRGLIGLIGLHGGASVGLETRADAAWLRRRGARRRGGPGAEPRLARSRREARRRRPARQGRRPSGRLRRRRLAGERGRRHARRRACRRPRRREGPHTLRRRRPVRQRPLRTAYRQRVRSGLRRTAAGRRRDRA